MSARFHEIEGVRLVCRDGAFSPPFIGIVGSLHGNELCGLEAIRALHDASHPVIRRLKRGTLVLIHGNPAATEEGRRFTRGGTDLNRIFDYRFLEDLPEEAWTIEHRRAAALKPVLDGLDAVLDLHSSTQPSPPFAIALEEQVGGAARLGCRWITYGWDGPGLLMDRVLIGRFRRRGAPAWSVECGQHHASETFAFAHDVVVRYLEQLDMLEGEITAPAPPGTVVQVVHRVGRPTVNFRFTRPFEGFDRVHAGEILGDGDGVRLEAQEDFYVLLPNPNVPVGDDMFYLGREVELA